MFGAHIREAPENEAKYSLTPGRDLIGEQHYNIGETSMKLI